MACFLRNDNPKFYLNFPSGKNRKKNEKILSFPKFSNPMSSNKNGSRESDGWLQMASSLSVFEIFDFQAFLFPWFFLMIPLGKIKSKNFQTPLSCSYLSYEKKNSTRSMIQLARVSEDSFQRYDLSNIWQKFLLGQDFTGQDQILWIFEFQRFGVIRERWRYLF